MLKTQKNLNFICVFELCLNFLYNVYIWGSGFEKLRLMCIYVLSRSVFDITIPKAEPCVKWRSMQKMWCKKPNKIELHLLGFLYKFARINNAKLDLLWSYVFVFKSPKSLVFLSFRYLKRDVILCIKRCSGLNLKLELNWFWSAALWNVFNDGSLNDFLHIYLHFTQIFCAVRHVLLKQT